MCFPGMGQQLLTFSRLHVVQQPRRARMCGFGDKVRQDVEPHLFLADAK
jgi:hypothetical protein